MINNRSIFVFVLSILLFCACGTQKKGLASSTGPKLTDVQTTFFGAKFGDRGETRVMEKMQKNGLGVWRSVDKGQYAARNVAFAGKTWYATHINFDDARFSRISFIERFNTKGEAIRFMDEMVDLLRKKYLLLKDSLGSKYEDLYICFDEPGNSVFVALFFLDDTIVAPWTCSVTYSWSKGTSIREQKALNEI